jgi:hypothetical protein
VNIDAIHSEPIAACAKICLRAFVKFCFWPRKLATPPSDKPKVRAGKKLGIIGLEFCDVTCDVTLPNPGGASSAFLANAVSRLDTVFDIPRHHSVTKPKELTEAVAATI